MKRRRSGCVTRICSVLLTVILAVVLARAVVKRIFPMPYEDEITAAAQQYQLSPALLFALIKAESNFDANATSAKGAKGLTQLMEQTAVWCAKKSGLPLTDIYNPAQNIAIGAYYLQYLMHMYNGEEACAIAAYNAGHSRVDTWLCDERYSADGKQLSAIPFAETEQYVKKITFYKKIYAWRMSE